VVYLLLLVCWCILFVALLLLLHWFLFLQRRVSCLAVGKDQMPEILNVCMIVSSALSICGCLVVFYFHFQLDKTQRNKAYNKIILYVVISDFFASIGTAFGIEEDNTFECSLQAFLTIAFPLCSIFWTTVTFYLFYLAIKNRQSSKNVMLYLHCICWGLPILFTLLPLAFGLRYGVKEGSDHEWCSLANPQDIPSWELTFWTFASFYAWVWLSVGGYSILISFIFYELKKKVFFTSDDTNDRLRPIVKKMIFLPMVIIFCWTMPTCYRIYYYINNENIYILQLMCAVSAALKGFLTCVLLITTNTVQTKFDVKKESKSLTQFRHSEQSNNPSDHFRQSSGSVLSQTSTFHDILLPSHRDRSSELDHMEHGLEDDEVDDEYDRYLFRVPNDHERMSRVSSDACSVVSSGVA
jgi:hypothetical protein